MSLHDVRLELAEKLRANGFRAVTDVRDVNPPCVLVGLPAGLTRRTLCSVAGTLTVTAIAPPPGNDDAAAWLLELIELVAPLIGWSGAEPSTWSTAGTSPTEHPAYTMTVPVQS